MTQIQDEALDGFIVMRRDGTAHCVAVDREDYARVMGAGPWSVRSSRNTFYSFRGVQRADGSLTMQQLHRFLLNPPDGMQVDHIDGNGLNCCRSNMRIVTRSENSQNVVQATIAKTSPYRGVHLDKRRNKWRAEVMINQKKIHLGLFEDEEDAALAAQAGRNRYFTHNVEDRHPVMEAAQ